MQLTLFILITLISLIGHGYLWMAIVNRLHGWNGPHRLIDFLTLLCGLSFTIIPLLVTLSLWKQGADCFLSMNSGSGVLALHNYYLLCFFVGLGKLLALLVNNHPSDDPTILVRKSRVVVPRELPFPNPQFRGIYPWLLGTIPFNETLQLVVDTKCICVPRLPVSLSGIRIVHISDWHLTGRVGPDWFCFVADHINHLSADVIAITGDLIENEACREWLLESMGQLQARLGVYFILGNHDYYIDSKRTVSDLEEAGLVYLGSDCKEIRWNDTPVILSGNEFPWADRHPSLPETPSFKICLMHTPDQYDWAVQNRIDLALAGHTHGGQICFPILGAVAAPSLYGTRFASGTFRQENTVMHVTRGISGETPLRWNCPPEIAVLELSCSNRHSVHGQSYVFPQGD